MGSYTDSKEGIKIKVPTVEKFKTLGCDPSAKVCPYSLVEENETQKEVLDKVVEDNKRMINSEILNDLRSFNVLLLHSFFQ